MPADSIPPAPATPTTARKKALWIESTQYLWKETFWWSILSGNKQSLLSHQENSDNKVFSWVSLSKPCRKSEISKERRKNWRVAEPRWINRAPAELLEVAGGQADVYPMGFQEGLTLRFF